MTPNPERDEPRQLRGLYKNVKVSVRTLNIAIIALVLFILVFVAFDLRNPGLQITFDSRGGSDVAPQIQMYGEPLNLPESPTREGYEFAPTEMFSGLLTNISISAANSATWHGNA